MPEAQENNKLFVGSLPYSIDDEGLSKLFSEVEGVTVVEAKVITDRFNNDRSKGFGFVTVETPEMAQAAIGKLHETEIDGRKIMVSVAKPREERPAGGGGGYQGGNRGGGDRGDRGNSSYPSYR